MIAIDYFLLALWLVLALRTKAALLPLFILLFDCISFELFERDFARYCLTAMTYFICSALNIRILSALRKAFFALGCVYLIGAADDLLFYHFNLATSYYSALPQVVTVFNALVAAILFSAGGWNIARIIDGLHSVANRCRFGL